MKAAQDDVLLLRENKGLLQKTMLEQLNGLRSEVKRLTVERDVLSKNYCVSERRKIEWKS